MAPRPGTTGGSARGGSATLAITTDLSRKTDAQVDRTGTLEPGKAGDVVLWSGTPFSVYSRADLVWIDGTLRYDRAHPPAEPDSDFLLGADVDEAAAAAASTNGEQP